MLAVALAIGQLAARLREKALLNALRKKIESDPAFSNRRWVSTQPSPP